MKVTVTHSIEFEKVRESIEELCLSALKPTSGRCAILETAIELYSNRNMSSTEFFTILDSHRKHLAQVDNSLSEVQTLLEGLSTAESNIANALNPPMPAPPANPSTQSIQESLSDVGDLLDELQSEGKYRMNVFSKGDLVELPADAPYYAIDCDSTGDFFVRSKSSKRPVLAIYLGFDQCENKATIWMNNQQWKVGIKYVRWPRSVCVS